MLKREISSFENAKKKEMQKASLFMREGGVEPPPRKPGLGPQPSASTNSAILANDIKISKSNARRGGRTPTP